MVLIVLIGLCLPASATPIVTNISPASGPTVGGTLVTITGTGFTGVTAVNFSSTPAASYAFISDTSISAIAPAGTAGTIDVTVTNPNGTSTTSTADQYTYTPVTTATTATPTATATTSPTTTATTAIPVINGTFSITSVPSYANVYIDSVFKGFTPLTLYNVTPDTYIVSIQKTGYVSSINQFNVTAGNTTYVSASLFAQVTESPTLAYQTAAITATTATPIKKYTETKYTPYPTATPTQQSPVPFELCCVAIALGLVMMQKKK